MLAKPTSKNQLTLPKVVVESVGAPEYFEVELRGGQVVLTPVRIQRGDAVRGKLEVLGLTVDDVDRAVRWARTEVAEPGVLAEPVRSRYARTGSARPPSTKAKTGR